MTISANSIKQVVESLVKKKKNGATKQSAKPTLAIYPKQIKSVSQKVHLLSHAYFNAIHNSLVVLETLLKL